MAKKKFYWIRDELSELHDDLTYKLIEINNVFKTTEKIIIYNDSINEDNNLPGFKKQQVYFIT
jgi:hypothetical protein